jgi:hypothetical protein
LAGHDPAALAVQHLLVADLNHADSWQWMASPCPSPPRSPCLRSLVAVARPPGGSVCELPHAFQLSMSSDRQQRA